MKPEISYEDCYNMNVTLANVIAQHLRTFAQVTTTTPTNLQPAEWEEMLNKMTWAFETYASANGMVDDEQKTQVKEGMHLFIDRIDDLWF